MRELNGQLKQVMTELEDLSIKIGESRHGFREQVSSILSMPPPRVLYQKAGHDSGRGAGPPGRSTLQAPRRRGHERRSSGDKKTKGAEKGFMSTL